MSTAEVEYYVTVLIKDTFDKAHSTYSLFAGSSFLEGGVIYTKMSLIFWDLLQVSRHRESMVLMPRKQTHELLG